MVFYHLGRVLGLVVGGSIGAGAGNMIPGAEGRVVGFTEGGATGGAEGRVVGFTVGGATGGAVGTVVGGFVVGVGTTTGVSGVLYPEARSPLPTSLAMNPAPPISSSNDEVPGVSEVIVVYLGSSPGTLIRVLRLNVGNIIASTRFAQIFPFIIARHSINLGSPTKVSPSIFGSVPVLSIVIYCSLVTRPFSPRKILSA